MQRLLAALTGLLLGAASARAQDAPLSADLVGQWDGWTGEYADVWGDGDYAYVCHLEHPGVHIIDVSDPMNPVAVAEFLSPLQGSAQDVKVHDGLMFVAVDGTGKVVIADVRDPTNPQTLTVVDTLDGIGPHNVFYDSGFLYQVDTERPIISIVDLSAYDPDQPPTDITTEKWRLTEVGNDFVHDITVLNGRLYASAWNGGIQIYDVSDVANSQPSFLGSFKGRATHSAWPTFDGKYVVTGEERRRGGIKVHRITESGGSLTLEITDRLKLRRKDATSVHNQLIDGYRLYNAWYESGLRVYDIDPDSGNLYLVAGYDTYGGTTGDSFGAWGVYPFLGPDKVLLSDIETGLYVVNPHGDVPCSDLQAIKAVRCREGTVSARVVMVDRQRDRQRLTFTIGNHNADVRVKRRRGRLKECCYEGPQTLTLTVPAGCFAPLEVVCD